VAPIDAGYRNNGTLCQAITGSGLFDVVAIQSATKVRPVCDDAKPPRVSVGAMALSLPKQRLAHRHRGVKAPA
jgi:hypothetical protein